MWTHCLLFGKFFLLEIRHCHAPISIDDIETAEMLCGDIELFTTRCGLDNQLGILTRTVKLDLDIKCVPLVVFQSSLFVLDLPVADDHGGPHLVVSLEWGNIGTSRFVCPIYHIRKEVDILLLGGSNAWYFPAIQM